MIKRVTIKDVAKVAGVTHTTVSRVIHNDVRISEKTQVRVRHAMNSLGYEPNLVARGLVQKRTKVIALITPELEPHTQPIVRSVAESCARNDYAMMLFPTNTWLKESLSFEWVAQHWLVDGVIVYNLIYHPEVPQEILDLQSRNLPFVFLNKFLEHESVNAVGVDNDQALDLVIDHFVSQGLQRIGMLYGDLTSADGHGRYTAFRNALERHGLLFDPEITACGYWYQEKGEEAMRSIFEKTALPQAMFCANDAMAMGAMRFLQQQGVRIPEDIVFIGFDDLEMSRYFDPPVSSVHSPLLQVGEEAVHLLIEIIRGRKEYPAPQQIKLPCRFIKRQSSG